MTKSEKSIVIERITSELNESKNIYLTDASGLNSVQTSKLRRACFKSNIKLSVVKNTLLEKAMTSSEKEFGELDQVLKGNTALMFSEIGNAPAKVIKEFRKKVEKPYNNRTIYGNSIKTHLADKISISKPKKWPVKGYFEKD